MTLLLFVATIAAEGQDLPDNVRLLTEGPYPHSSRITCLAASSGGLIATGVEAGYVAVWSPRGERLVRKRVQGEIEALCFASETVVFAGIRLNPEHVGIAMLSTMDSSVPSLAGAFESRGPVRSLRCISEDSPYVIISMVSAGLQVITHEPRGSTTFTVREASGFDFSVGPAGRIVVPSSGGEAITFLVPATGEIIREIELSGLMEHDSCIYAEVIGQAELLTVQADSPPTIRDGQGEVIQVLGQEPGERASLLSNAMIAVNTGGEIHLFDTNGERVCTIPGSGYVEHRGHNVFLVRSRSHSGLIPYDWEEGESAYVRRHERLHHSAIVSLAFDRPGRLVSADRDGGVAVWDLGENEEVQWWNIDAELQTVDARGDSIVLGTRWGRILHFAGDPGSWQAQDVGAYHASRVRFLTQEEILIGGSAGRVASYNLEDGDWVNFFPPLGILDFDYVYGHGSFAAATDTGVWTIDVSSGDVLQQVEFFASEERESSRLLSSSEGNLVYAAGQDVFICRVGTGEVDQLRVGGAIGSIVAGESYFAVTCEAVTGRGGAHVIVWDAVSLERIAQVNVGAMDDVASSLAFDPEERFLVIGTMAARVLVRDLS